MKFLRSSFLWILLILAAGLWVYRDLNPRLSCEKPIEYSIMRVDQGFNLSSAEYLSAIKEAENIWENATGKNLFDYEANPPKRGEFFKYVGSFFIRDPISMNLIYDERQQKSQERQGLISELSETKESADEVKAQFTALQDEYKRASAEYQSLVTQYRSHKVSYETMEAKRQQVNNLADQVNVLVRKYNSIVKDINATVRTVNQTAGQEFEEGQYVADQDGERINIYEFNSRQTLVRVLAHELGHALGLDHNENPDSIMYYLNNSKKMTPTKEDLAALGAICNAK